jgi:biopolymer transport protein ExbD
MKLPSQIIAFFATLFLASGICSAAPLNGLEIALKKDSVVIRGEEYPVSAVQAELEKIASEPDVTQQELYIAADTKVDYSEVMGVLEAAHKAGFTKIALVTDPAMRKD